ncbi:MAG: hypothetical protein NTW19_02890 [Planctomycetota bacterium]|nr:hypothetical protein [Planctomycetota bacterium]
MKRGPRWRRRLFNLAAGVSAAVFVVVVVGWGVSYWWSPTVIWFESRVGFSLNAIAGVDRGFLWHLHLSESQYVGPSGRRVWMMWDIASDRQWSRLSIVPPRELRSHWGWLHRTSMGSKMIFVSVPLGVILLPVAVLPGFWLIHRMRERKALRNASKVCLSCGYDLRGSPPAPGAACPECGTAIPKKEKP